MSTQVLQPVMQEPSQLDAERGAVQGMLPSVALLLSSCSNGLNNIGLTQEILDVASHK